YPRYLNLLGSIMGASMKKKQRMRASVTSLVVENLGQHLNTPTLFEHFTRGATQSHAEWLKSNELRFRRQRKFCRAFEQFDVILSPVAMTLAFEHQQSAEVLLRKLRVDGRKRH